MRTIKVLVALGLTLVFLATWYIYQENRCIAMYHNQVRVVQW